MLKTRIENLSKTHFHCCVIQSRYFTEINDHRQFVKCFRTNFCRYFPQAINARIKQTDLRCDGYIRQTLQFSYLDKRFRFSKFVH